MECVRDQIDPFTGFSRSDCECDRCDEDRWAMGVVDDAELSLRRVVVGLLEAGWMPNDIADAVRRRTSKRSRAWMLTRVELTCQAGHWLSRPAWYDHLDQADELSKYTGFHVGVTIPGWMRRWFTDKGHHDLRRLTDSVFDVWIAVGDESLYGSEQPSEPAVAVDVGQPSNIIAFPGAW